MKSECGRYTSGIRKDWDGKDRLGWQKPFGMAKTVYERQDCHEEDNSQRQHHSVKLFAQWLIKNATVSPEILELSIIFAAIKNCVERIHCPKFKNTCSSNLPVDVRGSRTSAALVYY